MTASGLVIGERSGGDLGPGRKCPWRGRLDDRWLRDIAGKVEEIGDLVVIDRNLWTCRGDLNLFIIRSRRLVGG
jgi:hypothetical protein